MKTFQKVLLSTAVASLAVVGCKQDKPEEKVPGIRKHGHYRKAN